MVLFAFGATSFGQQAVPKQHWTDSEYYKKSKKQKTAAWLLTGAGTAGLFITLLADASQAVGGGFITIISIGTVEPEYKSYTVPYLLGAACVISGVYLFAASSKNKKKAKAASVFMNIEKMPVLQGMVFSNQSVPAIGMRIRL